MTKKVVKPQKCETFKDPNKAKMKLPQKYPPKLMSIINHRYTYEMYWIWKYVKIYNIVIGSEYLKF
jgi:hypothetical protein